MITISSDMAAIHLFQNYFSWQMDHETLSQVERASGTKLLISNSLSDLLENGKETSAGESGVVRSRAVPAGLASGDKDSCLL